MANRNDLEFEKFDTQSRVKVAKANNALKMTVVGDVTYVAEALPGSVEADAVWRAKKIDETTGIVITWADGNDAFDNSAVDLAALSYS